MSVKKKGSKLVRKNIFMSKEIGDYYEKQAEKTGMSQSNLMVMALHKNMQEQQAVEAMNKYYEMEKRVKKLEQLKDQPQKD